MYRYLLLLGLAVYGRTLNHALLWWDDKKNICNNPYFQHSWTDALGGLWSEPFFGMYIPLTYSFWYSLAGLGGLTFGQDCADWAPLFHAFNLTLHLFNGWLVYKLLRKLVPNHQKLALALAVGVFLIHPIQVETVAWISGARDILSTALGLSGILVYLGPNALWALPLFALSILAKPVGVVFPLLLLLLERPKWKVIVPALAMAAGFSVFTKSMQNDSLLLFQTQLWERPLIAIFSLGFYVATLFWPFAMVPDYQRSVVALQAYDGLWWVALLSLLILLLAWRRREWRRPLAWCVLALLPVLGFVTFGFQEISTVADRFFYIPMIGISWGLVVSLSRAPSWVNRTSVVFVLVLAAISFRQVGFWQNDETLFRHVIAVNDSPMAHANLANVYFHRQDYKAAEPEYRLALERNSKLYDAWLGLGRTLELTQREAEAEQVYRKAIEAKAAVPATLNNLATLLYKRGSPESEVFWLKAAAGDPLYMEPRFNLGQFYVRVQQKEKALDYFRQALALAPGDVRIIERINAIQAGP